MRTKTPNPGIPQATRLVLLEVAAERDRQNALVAEGKLAWNCSTVSVPGADKLVVLAEEFGEAAQALHNREWHDGINRKDGVKTDLRKELIQLAAVCVAWVESLPVED